MTIPEGLLRALTDAYAHPPRAYHSFDHVQEVLRHFHSVPQWQHPREVYLAILFHDATYLAGKSDNEAKSADLAESAIKTWLPGEGIDSALVRRLIELRLVLVPKTREGIAAAEGHRKKRKRQKARGHAGGHVSGPR